MKEEISLERSVKEPLDGSIPAKETRKDWLKVVLFLFLGFTILSGVFYAGFWHATRKTTRIPKPEIPVKTPVSEPTTSLNKQEPTTPVTKGIAAGKIFYEKDNNIFSYDTKTKQIEKWTNYPKNKDYSPAYDESGKQIPSISIRDIDVIDKNTLGFAKCGVIVGDFGCGLYLLDLRTKDITQKKKLDNEDLLSNSGWFNQNRFAYLMTTKRNNGRWQLFLANDNETKLLVDLSSEGMGRGGFIEDSEKIEFSPNGNYFFHISTASARAIEDFTTHIYDAITGKELSIIQNSTMPSWIDNQRIIFRRYIRGDNLKNGLYVYNLNSKIETKVESISSDAYDPEVLSDEGKVVYRTDPDHWSYTDKKLWLYDLNSGENRLLLNNVNSGYWLSPTKIVFQEIELCSESEACGTANYKVKAIGIYDLTLERKIDTLDLHTSYGSSSLYH